MALTLLLLLAAATGEQHSRLFSDGPVEDATCNVEDVEKANLEQLHSILSELQNTTYMRLFRTDLERNCRYWNSKPIGLADSCSSPPEDDHSDGMCTVTGTAPPQSESQSETAFDWEPRSNSVDMTISQSENEAASVFTEDSSSEGCDDTLPPTFWVDMCSDSGGEDSEEVGEYVNLQKNPERWTGYNGAHIWKAIYEENCFKTGDMQDMCYEERVLYRLLSGMHSSINIHIASSFYPPRKGVRDDWAPNPERFMSQFAGHPDRLKNLHFAFVVMLRALQRAAPHFHGLSFDIGGNSPADEKPRALVRRLLDSSILQSCQPLFSAFDESLLFEGRLQPASSAITLKREFKGIFHNISMLLDCVACQKCRLHGKLALRGLGTTLKILLLPEHLISTALTREDIVAFFNTLSKFSEAIDAARRLTSQYWTDYDTKSQEEAKQKAERKSQPSSTAAPPVPPDRGREAAAPSVGDITELFALQDAAVELVARATSRGGWLEGHAEAEAAIVDAVFNGRPEVLLLAKHYSGDEARFAQHVCRTLSVTCGGVRSAIDVVVVGAGLAGLTASLSVLERGGKVVLVEREAFFGGNSAWASSGINAAVSNAETGDTLEAFQDDVRKSGGPQNEHVQSLQEVLTSKSEDALEWVRSTAGLTLDHVGQLGGHSYARTHRPEKGLAGSVMVSALQKLTKKYVSNGSLMIKKKTEAVEIVQAADGTVEGIVVKGPGGRESLSTTNVVITTGGFAADRGPESLLASVRPDLLSLPTTNGQWARGSGHRLAESAGAALMNLDHVQVHPTAFIDPKKPEAERKVLCAEITRGVGGILLDPSGNRFANELGTRDYLVAQMMKTVQKGKAPTLTIVLPPAAEQAAAHHVSLYSGKGLLTRYDTVADLAQGLNVPVTTLRATLTKYNDAAVAGEDEFGKKHFTNAPFPLFKGPFWAGHVTPALHYTMGGVMINPSGQVLRNSSDGALQPVPGLFAAGEVVGGVHGRNRLGGNALTECVVFGLSVGRSVPLNAQASRSNEPVQEQSPSQSSAPSVKDFNADELVKHSSESDLWISLYGKVYDFTDFLEEHPAGPEALLEQAGKDGTEIFKSVHSEDMLEDFEAIGSYKP